MDIGIGSLCVWKCKLSLFMQWRRRRSVDTVTIIVNFGTRRLWAVSFTLRSPYPREKIPRRTLNGASRGSRNWSKLFVEEKDIFLLPGIETLLSTVQLITSRYTDWALSGHYVCVSVCVCVCVCVITAVHKLCEFIHPTTCLLYVSMGRCIIKSVVTTVITKPKYLMTGLIFFMLVPAGMKILRMYE
jgi:hypothetical protein